MMVESRAKSGDTPRATIRWSVRPVLTCVHVSPASEERKMPSPNVPAYTVRLLSKSGGMTSASTAEVSRMRSSTCVHDPPPFIDRKTPSPVVPANRVSSEAKAGDTTRAGTNLLVRPLFARSHESPRSVDLRTPPEIPAKTVSSSANAGEMAMSQTKPLRGPNDSHPTGIGAWACAWPAPAIIDAIRAAETSRRFRIINRSQFDRSKEGRRRSGTPMCPSYLFRTSCAKFHRFLAASEAGGHVLDWKCVTPIISHRGSRGRGGGEATS